MLVVLPNDWRPLHNLRAAGAVWAARGPDCSRCSATAAAWRRRDECTKAAQCSQQAQDNTSREGGAVRLATGSNPPFETAQAARRPYRGGGSACAQTASGDRRRGEVAPCPRERRARLIMWRGAGFAAAAASGCASDQTEPPTDTVASKNATVRSLCAVHFRQHDAHPPAALCALVANAARSSLVPQAATGSRWRRRRPRGRATCQRPAAQVAQPAWLRLRRQPPPAAAAACEADQETAKATPDARRREPGCLRCRAAAWCRHLHSRPSSDEAVAGGSCREHGRCCHGRQGKGKGNGKPPIPAVLHGGADEAAATPSRLLALLANESTTSDKPATRQAQRGERVPPPWQSETVPQSCRRHRRGS